MKPKSRPGTSGQPLSRHDVCTSCQCTLKDPVSTSCWLVGRTKRAPEKGLRIRAGIDLEDATYAGRRTSRSAVFGNSDDSEDDSDGDLEADDSDGSDAEADQESAEEESEDGHTRYTFLKNRIAYQCIA